MLVGAGTVQVRSPVMENDYGIIKKFCEENIIQGRNWNFRIVSYVFVVAI